MLQPLHRGDRVAFRPPAWSERDRPGMIAVDAGAQVVLIEGVGASRRELSDYLDAVVWVQSDRAQARARGIARDGGTPAAMRFWDKWEREEAPFLAA
ncbi:MAG: hypothetical protein ACR2MA_04165 [Egibacteraceae bacterium]